MIAGIDIGSTTTKAVLRDKNKIVSMIRTKALDPITSATGILGKMLFESNIPLTKIERISITGAGSSKIDGDIFSIPTIKVDEITAIGRGGMYLSGGDDIIITNIGTGTAIIEANNNSITHIGGTGIGGGTILGLSKKMLGTIDIENIVVMAHGGNLHQVDLLVGDIVDSGISFLNKDSTASNFGKMLDSACNEDIAMAIINLVYQVIGVMSVFAVRSRNKNAISFTGNGSTNELGKKILISISAMYDIEFNFPENPEYATALGAALI
jgi:type II pantothenate kinase